MHLHLDAPFQMLQHPAQRDRNLRIILYPHPTINFPSHLLEVLQPLAAELIALELLLDIQPQRLVPLLEKELPLREF